LDILHKSYCGITPEGSDKYDGAFSAAAAAAADAPQLQQLASSCRQQLLQWASS
jgi:hypothetical protein